MLFMGCVVGNYASHGWFAVSCDLCRNKINVEQLLGPLPLPIPSLLYLCFSHSLSTQEGLPSRALDIGCAVGRSTFELAREFDEVVGIDYSSAFIAKCQQLKITGESDYTLTVEGDLVQRKTARVSQDIVSHHIFFLLE